MQHFPIFVAMQDTRVVVSGGGAAALAKLRLLMKTPATITVFAVTPAPEIVNWARQGHVALELRDLQPTDLAGVTLVYAADEDDVADNNVRDMAKDAGVLVNVVDNLQASDFITPAMVDRAPVTVAIGTEGTAPMLARKIKASLEEGLPVITADLAKAAAAFRPQAEVLPHGEPRRAFWAEWFDHAGPFAAAQGNDLSTALNDLLARHTEGQSRPNRITLTWAISDDPDLLVMKARRALDEADVVVHSAGVAPQVLELARREAEFVTLHHARTVPPLPRLLTQLAKGGRHVLYLADRPIGPALAHTIRQGHVEVTEVPGLTTPQKFAKQEQA